MGVFDVLGASADVAVVFAVAAAAAVAAVPKKIVVFAGVQFVVPLSAAEQMFDPKQQCCRCQWKQRL